MRAAERRNTTFLYTTLECNQKLSRRRLRRKSDRCFFERPSSHRPSGRDRKSKAKKVSELIETANRFADGEDTYNNKRGQSPEVDKTSRQRRRYRNGDNHGRRNEIATGYDERNEEGYENVEFLMKDSRRKEKPRYSGPSAEDMLYGPCRIHYAYLDGKRVSNHQMKDCRTFLRSQNAMDSSQGAR
jgi:hypothetical protein